MSLHLDRQLASLKYGLVWRKPQFLARMAGFYFQSFGVRKRQPLRYVDFAIDYACNLKCAHCFATSLEKSSRPRLQVSDYRRIAKECIELGAIHLSLQGGEATLVKNLDEMLANMSPRKVLFSITTNGTTITPDLARKLRKWGVDQLNISIDSFIPAEHDKFRGVAGAWQKTFDGLQTARRTGLHVQVNTTVSKYSLYKPGFRKLVDYCITNRILLNIVLAAPSGNWDANLDATLNEDDMKVVRAIIQSSAYVRQDMDSIVLGRGCPAMKEAIYITPYGDVLCCPFIHVSFGNLHDEPLKAIVDRALKYPFLETHAKKCLVAEERVFIDKYLSKTFGKKNLPADCQAVFGSPEEVAKEYTLPKPVVVPDNEVASVVNDWRNRS
jgi:MoaA/NifB/PqqE/SkfB family radical SAM enzyme